MALIDACSLPLARPVRAAHDSPRFTNSQMDGYALASTAAGEREVGATVAAGADPDAAYPGGIGELAVPVMTGAKLPRGTVAVVPVEACEPPEFPATGERVRVPESRDGQFIRPAGCDIAAGQELLAAGTRVTPAVVGALAAQGITEVEVERRARVLIVTGGAEVGRTGPASVPDANGPMLQALCARAGIEVAGHLRTDDDPVRLREALHAAVERHAPDAVITSGGISHGKYEVVRQALDGGWFGHVTQQPGGPQGLAAVAGVPVIALPGNPVSTLVSFRLFVAPALGHAPEPVRVPLATATTGLADKDQFLRGQLRNGAAHPAGAAGSHFLAQAAAATCLIRIPAGAQLAPGDLALVYPL